MPLVPRPVQSDAGLLDLAQARWTAIEAAQPGLRPALQVQRHVLPIVIELVGVLREQPLPKLSLPAGYVAAKLSSGVPAFSAEPVPLPIPVLVPYVVRLAKELACSGAGPAAERIAAAVQDRQIDAATLLAASFARDVQSVRAAAVRQALVPDLVWLIAELATCPFGHALQQVVLGRSRHEALAHALQRWIHGYCPACGSWPALAEVIDERQVLRCSFCATAWRLDPQGCVYCTSRDGTSHQAGIDSRSDESRIETCGTCRGYLKIVRVASLSPFPLLAITDLETMTLDVHAMAQGYSRPAPRQHGRAP